MNAPDRPDGVLVLDTGGQCGLSVVRSLGKLPVSVTAAERTPRSLGMLSRYSDASYVYPDPAEDAGAFIDHLVDHLERSAYDVVIPADDHTSLLLARHKQELEATGPTVGVEDWPTFERAYDKAKLFEVIETLDVPAPATYAPTSMTAVTDIAETIDYPAVVKPRSKSHFRDGECVTTLVTADNYVESATALRRTYRQIVDEHDGFERQYPLVQEFVPGTTTTTVALSDRGVVGAYFQEERLRTYPSSGGNSALLGAVREPEMLEHAERILGGLEWSGPAMVEFKRKPDGTFSIIEVNGRYWGSLPFAIACGVDFPKLHYRQLVGIDPSPCAGRGQYRTDIQQRRLLYEDIKWICENVADGNLRALGPFFGAFARTRHTFVSYDDPIPTLGAVAQAARLGGREVAKVVSSVTA
jgi:predicted ATP-grasp superfamily ATP-dependent carboligase